MSCDKYVDKQLDLDFYEKFLNFKESSALYTYLDKTLQWKTGNRRSNITFGDTELHSDGSSRGLIYEVDFQGNIIKREAIPWDPEILKIRDKASEVTHEQFNICVVMKYPTGKVGINPHRDKEMKHGTIIAGVSLGETRTLSMSRGSRALDLELPPGSMYVFNPPTNDFWAHSILKDESTGSRISLTFRNYRK